MSSLQHLIDKNHRWAEAVAAREPDFFRQPVEQQSPRYLRIDCSDSRVPANEIVDLLPGELFVHRNVANVVVHTDLNCLSVLQYAVDVMQVEHVIVVGHCGCGGVRAAWQAKPLGLVDNWLRHVVRTTIVQDTWQRGQAPALHGWICALGNGLVTDLRVTADAQEALEQSYFAAIARYGAAPADAVHQP